MGPTLPASPPRLIRARGVLPANFFTSSAPSIPHKSATASAKFRHAITTLLSSKSYNDLKTYISEDMLSLHQSKHHHTSVASINNALNTQAVSRANISVLRLGLPATSRSSASRQIDHAIAWDTLTPPSRTAPSPVSSNAPALFAALTAQWGSVENFKAKFEAVVLALQGNGWGWLVQDVETRRLEILTCNDEDTVPRGKKPLLGVDLGAHAYSPQCSGNKKGCVAGIWNVMNWVVVEKRLEGSGDALSAVKMRWGGST